MDKVYQVFVSSTFSDLKDERLQVSNTLAKAGYIPAGMELFPATDQQQLEYIERVIDRSDYYVIILGARYGSLSDDGKSYTEREFEYAQSKRIPVLAFLHENPRALAVEKTDEDARKAELLEAFRARVQTGRIVEFWRDPNSLCTKVLIAVSNAVNLRPGVGWVRGDQAIDPKVLQETERLRIENTELRQKLAESILEEVTFDPSLLGPNDTMPLKISVDGQRQPVVFEVPIGDIFVAAYDGIVAGKREPHLAHDLGKATAKCAGRFSPNQSFLMDKEDVTSLRNQMEALGLVKALSAEEGAHIVWSLTEKGRKYAAKRRAIRKAASAQD